MFHSSRLSRQLLPVMVVVLNPGGSHERYLAPA